MTSATGCLTLGDFHGGLGVNARRVEDGQVRVLGADQHGDLSAAENDAVGADPAQALDLARGRTLWTPGL
jgi:hypothetical protein